MVSNVETIQTSVGFGEKSRVNTLAVENLENRVQVPITRATHPSKITILTTTRLNPQMRTKHTMIQLIPGVTTKKLCTTLMTRNMKRFLHMLLWMVSPLWRQLNWMRLLFLPTRGTMISILKRVRRCLPSTQWSSWSREWRRRSSARRWWWGTWNVFFICCSGWCHCFGGSWTGCDCSSCRHVGQWSRSWNEFTAGTSKCTRVKANVLFARHICHCRIVVDDWEN